MAVGGRVMDGSQRLDGKSAIVVGAAQGIGRTVTLCFAGAGAHVLCADEIARAALVLASPASSFMGSDLLVDVCYTAI